MQFRCSLFDDTLVDRGVDRWTKVDREVETSCMATRILETFRPSESEVQTSSFVPYMRSGRVTHTDNIQNISEYSEIR